MQVVTAGFIFTVKEFAKMEDEIQNMQNNQSKPKDDLNSIQYVKNGG